MRSVHPVIPLVQPLRQALCCGDPRCTCRRPSGNVHCPAHEDRTPSLSITTTNNGRVLVHCHAGCSQDAVISALRERGLWPDQQRNGLGRSNPVGLGGGKGLRIATSRPHEVARKVREALWCSPLGEPFDGKPEGPTYHPDDEWFPGVYVSVGGNGVIVDCGLSDPQPVLQVLRRDGVLPTSRRTRYEIRSPERELLAIHVREDLPNGDKKLWWECPDGTRGLNGLRPTDLLFGLEFLRERLGKPVVVVEGEKAAAALQQAGFLAVGTVCGAAAVPGEGVLQHLLDRPVILWPDADEPGRRHMHGIAEVLHRLGHRDVRMVEPPEGVRTGWDAADAVAEGQDVRTLLASARPIRPSRQGPVLLTAAEVLAAADSPEPDWLVDGLIPGGGVGLLVGRPKSGKSTLARALAMAVLQGRTFLGRKVQRGPVLLISLEDRKRDVARHLRSLGLRAEDPLRLATELRNLDQLRAWVQAHRPVLVIIDTLGRVLHLRDSSEYAEVTAALDGVLHLARESGAAFFLLHHAPKGSDTRDTVDAPLGSTAFAGTPDVILHLKRGQDGTRTLKSVQRVGEDLPESVLMLGEDGWPALAGTKQEHQTRQVVEGVLAFLRAHGEATRQEVLDGSKGVPRMSYAPWICCLPRDE